MYKLTIFTGIFDNKTHKSMSFDSLEKFEKILYDLSKQEGYKPKRGEFKKGSPLISPATYVKDTTRKNDNVVNWGRWAALDIDDYESSFEDAIKIFKDYYYICYSSASSTKEHPKFRIVLPLTEEVKADKIRHFWYALNTEFESLGDKQTKDLSRMYYVPAQYPNAYNFIFTNKGPLLDPNTLMDKHEYVSSFKSGFSSTLPLHVQKQMEEYKKSRLTNTNIHWSSYHDCPFVNKQMVAEYKTITGSGWYTKMYGIMVSIAGNAIKKGYPITPQEITTMCTQIDNETGGWYKSRPMMLEASRAIDFALKN